MNTMISILMPTYNSERTIIKSISNIVQINKEFEILIADGGSNDKTIELIKTFNDARIRILSEDDTGLYDGINKLVFEITGKYVQFVNSDDYINPQYSAHCVDFLENNSEFSFCYGSIIKNNQIIGPRVKSKLFKYQFMPFPHISLVIRKDDFVNLMPFNLDYCITADNEFVWRLLEQKTLRGFRINDILAANVDAGGLSDGIKHLKQNNRIAKKFDKNCLIINIIYLLQVFKFLLKNTFGGK